jgi:TP901 family phage tail tape measure protein
MTASNLPAFTGTANLDVAPWRKGARDALSAIREVVDFAKKNGTLTLTAKLAGASAASMRTQLTAAIGTTPVPVTIAFNNASISAALASLRTQLNGVVSINTSTLTALQIVTNTQIAQITALIAQLRALGSGGGGGGRGGSSSGISASSQKLLADLEKLNNEYKRGDVNANDYGIKLAGLQSALRVAAAMATVGTAEFKALDAAVTRAGQGFRNIETGKIVQLKTELSSARVQFDAAASAATNFAQRQAALAGYNAELQRIKVALQGLAASGNLTAQQLGAVNERLKAIAVESARVNSKLNLAGLSSAVGGALQQLTGFIPGMQVVTGLFSKLPPQILAVAAAATGMTAAFASAFRTAAEFQQVMADIRALTQPTADGLETLRQAGLNVGVPLGVGARKAAAAMLELNRAGLSATDVIEGGLVGALNLAGAAGITAAEGGKLAVAAMTAFQLTAQDLPGVADVFANFANKTFLGATDLSMAIASVGPVAEDAGLKLNEFSGYMAVLAQGGFRRMTDAGTSFKAVLLSLISPVGMAAGAMDEIGLSSYDAAGNMRPVSEILSDLRGKMAGLTQQAQKDVLRRLFGSDGIRAATILLRQGADSIQATIDAMGLQGEAARVAADRLTSYNGSVEKLKASWERFTILMGEKLLPAMTGVVDVARVVVDALGGVGNTMDTLRGYALSLALAIGAIRANAIAAAAPALWAAFASAVTGFFGAASAAASAFLALNPFALLAVGVGGLAAFSNKIMSETASVYDSVDQANEASFDATMKRVAALNKEGTEISRTQAKMLLATSTLQNAEQGTLTGVTLFGERTYEVDPAKVEEARAKVEALKKEVVALRTEAGRRGNAASKDAGVGVSPERLKEQITALNDLQATLSERKFALKLEGMSEIDSAVAQLGKTFDDLRVKVKAAFGGNLNNSELKTALAGLTQQQAGEEKALRAKFAKEKASEAAKTARESALDVQRAEIEAMQEGAAKRRAERQAEVAQINRDTADKVKLLGNFPARQAELESNARRIIAAKRRGWAAEDQAQARENAQRVQDAQQTAASAKIAALEDGLQKEEALRAAALASLRADIAERINAAEGDPAGQAKIQGYGNEQLAALEAQQNRERVAGVREAEKQVVEVRTAARDAEIALIQNASQRKRAEREKEVADFRLNLQQQVAALKDYPQLQQQVLAEGRRLSKALEQKWAQEDERDAKERAQRIVQAFQEARAAQEAAGQAGRDAEGAKADLSVSRRVALAREDALQVAQIEAQAAREKTARVAQNAAILLGQDKTRLVEARVLALQADNLSSEERRAIWQKYYADLDALDNKNQADSVMRTQQREEQERASAEAIRLARIQQANTPVEQGSAALTQLEATKALALTDREILQINGEIAGIRERQLAALQGQLDGQNGVRLNAQEAQKVQEQIAGLQRDQLVSQREQVASAHELVSITLDRLDAEAQYAERSATTEAQRLQAQQRQLAIAQTRIRELDSLIAAEGREKERNALINQRFDLLGQIEGLSSRIDNAPLEGEQRRLDLYKAQAQAELILRGLGDDKRATSELTVQIAARELVLANQKVAAARTELELQTALVGQAQARTGFAQALLAQQQVADDAAREGRDAGKEARQEAKAQAKDVQDNLGRELGLQNDLQDAAEARAKAVLQVTGLADDALSSAQQELDTARAQLALTEQQLRVEGLADERRAELLGRRLGLLGEQAAQERQLIEVRAAGVKLAQDTAQAEADLTRELAGGTSLFTSLTQATQKLAEARLTLTDAEQEYARARLAQERLPTSANAEKLKGATNALTGAIRSQRDAVKGLADEYRSTIGQMDSVRAAGQQLAKAAYGESGKPVDLGQETRRLDALEQRRNASAKTLQAALEAGDKAGIQRAAQDLAVQQERYTQQADLVEKNSLEFKRQTRLLEAPEKKAQLEALTTRQTEAAARLEQAIQDGNQGKIVQAQRELQQVDGQIKKLTQGLQNASLNRTGSAEVQKLADQVDGLGIEYDRDAVLLEERATLADQESQTALLFSRSIGQFSTSGEAFERNTQALVAALDGTYAKLINSAEGAKNNADKEAAEAIRDRQDALLERQRAREKRAAARDAAELDTKAAQIAGAKVSALPQVSVPQTNSQQLVRQLAQEFGQQLRSASPANQRLAPTQETRPVITNHQTFNYGDIHITQQPGQDARAVAQQVKTLFLDDARRAGKNC